jgi:hypothetical protein
VSYRKSPFTIIGKPGMNGDLVGKNAKDMRLRHWGDLKAISQGSQGYWTFQCLVCGHTFLLNGNLVRQRDVKGRPNHCPNRSTHAAADACAV